MDRNGCWETYREKRYRQFVVANIDLLGQRQKLRQLAEHTIDDLSANPKPEGLKQLEIETFKAVTRIRDVLDKAILEDSGEPDLIASSLPEADRAIAAEMFRSHAISQSFSDSLIYHVCLDRDPCKPAATILRVLLAIATMMPIALSYKQPLRGGIEFHWAANIGGDEIYGPAPYMAYHLESHVAQYPRVVIGQGAMEYLDCLATSDGSGHQERIARNLAGMALGVVATDSDGICFLDYLGKGYRRIRSDKGRRYHAANFLGGAYAFVLDSLSDLRLRAGQSMTADQLDEIRKLTLRYEQLKDYFDDRLGLWVEDGFEFPKP